MARTHLRRKTASPRSRRHTGPPNRGKRAQTTSASGRKKPARRSNEQWSKHTREALIDAAKSIFAARGYHGASIAVIAEAAGLTKGAVYHHFRDKRELFRAVVVELQRAMVAEIDAVASKATSAVEALLAGSETYLRVLAQPDIARIVLSDGPSVLGLAEWRAIDDEIGGSSLRAGIRAAMDRGEIATLDLPTLSATINGALNELAMTIARADRPERRRREALETLRRLLEGLRE